MNQIAVFYGDTTIYFSSILIALALLTAFIFSLAIYMPRHRFGIAMWIFFPTATVASVLASRIIHWYCNPEQYVDFKTAITDYSTGDYCIIGAVFATLAIALILRLLQLVRSSYDLLDAAAPGLAFVIAMVRFSHIFSDKCYGKMLITEPAYRHLPIAAPIIGSDGNAEYRFASFFVSFIIMLISTVLIALFYMKKHDIFFNRRAAGVSLEDISVKVRKSDGHTFRLFLLLFAAEEVIIDSTRYDASHLFFSGEQFAGLNKGASFMGLSQFISALILLYLFIYYLVKSVQNAKARSLSKKYLILTVSLFVIGLAAAGGCEYLVQRFTGMFMYIYPGQAAGLCCMIAAIIIMYFKSIAPRISTK